MLPRYTRAGHGPVEGEEVHLCVLAAHPVQLPRIVEGRVDDAAGEVPLHAADLHLVLGDVLVHLVNPSGLLIELPQGWLVDLCPSFGCSGVAAGLPRWLCAHRIGADVHHAADAPPRG